MTRILIAALGAAGLALAACGDKTDDATTADAAGDMGANAAATAPMATDGAMAPADGAPASADGAMAPAPMEGSSTAGTTTRTGTAPVGATLRGDSPGTATPLPEGQATTYTPAPQ